MIYWNSKSLRSRCGKSLSSYLPFVRAGDVVVDDPPLALQLKGKLDEGLGKRPVLQVRDVFWDWLRSSHGNETAKGAFCWGKGE